MANFESRSGSGGGGDDGGSLFLSLVRSARTYTIHVGVAGSVRHQIHQIYLRHRARFRNSALPTPVSKWVLVGLASITRRGRIILIIISGEHCELSDLFRAIVFDVLTSTPGSVRFLLRREQQTPV